VRRTDLTAVSIRASFVVANPDYDVARRMLDADPMAGHAGPDSPPPSTATGNSPTTTPGSAVSSPLRSATSGRHGPE
jgi:hypothetical protein